MTKLSAIAVTLIVFTVIATDSGRYEVTKASVERQSLESYVGKYPSELFKSEPGLKRRVKTLLGPNYSFFMARLQVEMPIENIEGTLLARGCMAHSCGIEEAILAIGLNDGKLHAAILSKKFGGKFRLFSEDKGHVPAALRRAIEQR
jgi:hypothetical protein